MPSLNTSAQDSRIAVYAGRRGAGKSFLMAKHAERLIESGRFANVVCFDPMVCLPEWSSLCSEKSIRLKYLEFDFGKKEVVPAIPFGKAKTKNDPSYEHSLYIFDEVDTICSPNSIHPSLAAILNYSRHWDCTVLANFRRFARISKDLEGLATDFFIFQMVAPRDLAAVDNILSGIPDTTGSEVTIDRVKSLPLFKHIHVRL